MSKPPEVIDSILSIEGRIATLTFNRDDLRNALTGTALVSATADWLSESGVGISGEAGAFI